MNQSQVMPSDNDRRRVSVGLLLMGGGIALLVADLVWHLSPASIPLFWFYLESLVPLRVHLLRFGGAIFLLLGSLLVAAGWVVWRAERAAAWSETLEMLSRPIALVLIFLLFGALIPDGKFFGVGNIENILVQSAVVAACALGATMVIISAGIDLSAGSVIALTVVLIALLTDRGPAIVFNGTHATALAGLGLLAALTIHGWAARQALRESPSEGLRCLLIPLYWFRFAGRQGHRGARAVLPVMLILFGLALLTWLLGTATAQAFFGRHQVLWTVLAVLLGLLASALAGAATGALITGLRIVPFVVTLGGLQLYRGLAKGFANEQNIYPRETWINTLMDPVLGNPDRAWLVLPIGVWITAVAAVFAGLLLRYTQLGRHIFAVGSSEQTARLCGVPVVRTKILVYTLAGFFAGLAGLLQYSYLGIGQPTTAVGYELLVIAAVVIGGGSLMGGEGTITGTLIGALTIGVLAAGSVQMGWPKWVQEIVTGSIIILAVTVDQWRHRRVT
jgi:ribose/xylose/arabinose/galactoside ABC-type transport system permease subunit